MRRLSRVLFLLFLFCILAAAQHTSNTIENVAEPFKSFKYSEVIDIADSILAQDSLLSSSDLMEIYRMKALSHFSLGEELYAKNCFHEILKLNPRFKLDPVQNSPKIISFFNQIKLDYLQNQITIKDSTPFEEIKAPSKTTFSSYSQKNIKSAIVKSLVLPGWGHLYLDKKKSGIVLLMGSIVTLPSMIYFIFDTNQKEKDYLNQTNFDDIQNKYDRYNQSYKIRNGLIAGYALIWVYSQWDLFSSDSPKQPLIVQPAILNNHTGQMIRMVQFIYRF